jgi:hypothetical protein
MSDKKHKDLITPKEAIQITSDNKKNIKDRLSNINEIAKIIKEFLKDGVDYGVIPGTKKPTLFKSGAQKIIMLYGLTAIFTLLKEFKGIQKIAKQEVFIEEFRFKCELFTFKDHKKVAEGIGHISTLEKGKKDNPTNTLLKMSKKRAMVDATLQIGALSEIFTQDLDDMTLSTKNSKLTLQKYEKLGVYGKIYKILGFDNSVLNKDEQTVFKNKAKVFISNAIKQLEIPTILDQQFNKEHMNILLKTIESNKEKFLND